MVILNNFFRQIQFCDRITAQNVLMSCPESSIVIRFADTDQGRIRLAIREVNTKNQTNKRKYFRKRLSGESVKNIFSDSSHSLLQTHFRGPEHKSCRHIFHMRRAQDHSIQLCRCYQRLKRRQDQRSQNIKNPCTNSCQYKAQAYHHPALYRRSRMV
jgi:hypothetical protein